MTGGLCHICGGRLHGDRWVADHISAHATGGSNQIDNFLPAHRKCNGYKWYYTPKELQLMLRMAIWARNRMVNSGKATFGDMMLRDFWSWERRSDH